VAELHILNLLETIKHQQDQLVIKVNYLSSRLNSTRGQMSRWLTISSFPWNNWR